MMHYKKGFTLIELLLAMAFLTFLLLFMVTASLQVMRSYNKGIALKQINQTARTTLEGMTRMLRSSDGSTLKLNALAQQRFCVGGTSYVWNLKNATTNKKDDASSTPVGLVSVQDPGANMCAAGSPVVPAAQSTDLLTGRVWVQNIDIKQSTDRELVEITLSLSTTGSSAPFLDSGQLSCGSTTVGEFCAFANFNTVVNTRGGGQ